MKILVTFAVDAEFAPWRRLRPFRVRKAQGTRVFTANAGDGEINVILTGIGAARASRAVRLALEAGADFCISTGLAGSLNPRYPAGEILVARAVRSESARSVHCDEGLYDLAVEQGAEPVAKFLSATHILVRAEEKTRNHDDADAVEMESFAVLAGAHSRGVPAVALRAISDTAGEDLPLDFNRVLGDDGNVSMPRLLGQLAAHPLRFPALLRFGQQSRRAAENLCRFLDRYVVTVARVEQRRETAVEALAG